MNSVVAPKDESLSSIILRSREVLPFGRPEVEIAIIYIVFFVSFVVNIFPGYFLGRTKIAATGNNTTTNNAAPLPTNSQILPNIIGQMIEGNP